MNRGGGPAQIKQPRRHRPAGSVAMRPTVDRLLVISADGIFLTGTAAEKPRPTGFYIVSPLGDAARLPSDGSRSAVSEAGHSFGIVHGIVHNYVHQHR